MKTDIKEDIVYMPTDMVVAREIEGELIIVPLEGGIADLDDALYTFNETGRRIWHLMGDGLPVKKICEQLSEEFDASKETIYSEVAALIRKLLEMKVIQKAE
jgi:hypothetical protein